MQPREDILGRLHLNVPYQFHVDTSRMCQGYMDTTKGVRFVEGILAPSFGIRRARSEKWYWNKPGWYHLGFELYRPEKHNPYTMGVKFHIALPTEFEDEERHISISIDGMERIAFERITKSHEFVFIADGQSVVWKTQRALFLDNSIPFKKGHAIA